MVINMEKVKITTEFIKLQQFMKLSGVVGQGSDAKMLVQDGIVMVNGEICTQRGKKIRVGDIVEVIDFGIFEAVGE